MAKKAESSNLDASTEERIKEAARIVFHQKGFAATRTRDIAVEAGINLALLNYYFRSKQKLFEIIMTETLSKFLDKLLTVVDDEKTTIEEKVGLLATGYIDFLSEEPGVPLFIMSEIRNNPEALFRKMTLAQNILSSKFIEQFREAVKNGEVEEIDPMQFLMNLLGLIVFPFIAQPLLMHIGEQDEVRFMSLMQERKKMIPVWIGTMFRKK